MKHLIEQGLSGHWYLTGKYDTEAEADRAYRALRELHPAWTVRRIVVLDIHEPSKAVVDTTKMANSQPVG